MARKRFKSYAECEAAFDKASAQADLTHAALADVLRQEVVWYKKGAYKAGLSRLDSLSGIAIVIVIYRHPGQKDTVLVDEAERWAREQIRHVDVLQPKAGDKELIDIRDLAYEVLRKLAKGQEPPKHRASASSGYGSEGIAILEVQSTA